METWLRVTLALREWGDSKALSPFSFSGLVKLRNTDNAKALVSTCAVVSLSLPFQLLDLPALTAFDLWTRGCSHFGGMPVSPIYGVNHRHIFLRHRIARLIRALGRVAY